MYKRLVDTLYVLNIVFQSFYTLALPIGIGCLASYLLVRFASAPRWIWAVLLIIGTFCGLFSMIKFLISATKNLERMEQERSERAAIAKEKEAKKSKLQDELIKKEGEWRNEKAD